MPRAKKSVKAVTPADVDEKKAAESKGRKTKTAAAAAAAAPAVAQVAVETAKSKRKAGAAAAASGTVDEVEADKAPVKKAKKKTAKQIAADARKDAELAELNAGIKELKQGSALNSAVAAAAAAASAAVVEDPVPAPVPVFAAPKAASVPMEKELDGDALTAALNAEFAADSAPAPAAASAAPAVKPKAKARVAPKKPKVVDLELKAKLDKIKADKKVSQKEAADAARGDKPAQVGRLVDNSGDAKLCCWEPFEKLARRIQREYENNRMEEFQALEDGLGKALGALYSESSTVKKWREALPFRFQESQVFLSLQAWVQSFLNDLMKRCQDAAVMSGNSQILLRHLRYVMYADQTPMGGTYRLITLPLTVAEFGGFDPRPDAILLVDGSSANRDDVLGDQFKRVKFLKKLITERSSQAKIDSDEGVEDPYLDGLTSRALRRLSATNMNPSMAHVCYDELRAIVASFLYEALSRCSDLALHSNRNTIFDADVVFISRHVWKHHLPVKDRRKKWNKPEEEEDDTAAKPEDSSSSSSDDEEEKSPKKKKRAVKAAAAPSGDSLAAAFFDSAAAAIAAAAAPSSSSSAAAAASAAGEEL